MRNALLAAAIAVFSAAVSAAEAPVPKEGRLSATQEMSGAITFLQLGTERLQMTWDTSGTRTSDIGDVLHGAKVRCVGGALAINGRFDDESSSCIYTLPDGDQAFALAKGAGKVGGEVRGTISLVGGTGKLSGITGTLEFTRAGSTVSDGIVKSVSKSSGGYRMSSATAPGSTQAVDVGYQLFRPDGPGPHPAIVFLSGCSGFGPPGGALRKSYERHAAELRKLGFVVAWADYLGRRNLASCATGGINQEEAGRDAVAAASWLRSQSYVDSKRITAMGWSYGGGAVFAALGSHGADELIFTRAIVYYPYCAGVRPWSNRLPLLVLRGGSDNVAPSRLCESALGTGSRTDVKVVEYPEALHGFDLTELPPRMEYPFGTLGYDPKAAAAARDEVRQFLGSGGVASSR